MSGKLPVVNVARQAGDLDEAVVDATRARYQSGLFTRSVLQPLLIALMVTAVGTGMLMVIRAVTADDRWLSWLPLLFLIALEAIYTTLWLDHPDRLGLSQAAYRGAELFILFLIIRIGTMLIFAEGLPTRDELIFYLRSPFSFLLNGTFIASFLVALIVWRLAMLVSGIFSRLALSEFEIRFYSLPLPVRKALGDDQPITGGRSALTEQFLQFWLWGGILLTICAALSTLDLSTVSEGSELLAITRLGLHPLLLASLLFYFLGGFWLLSQARLATLNAQWLVNGVDKTANLEGRWRRASLLILLAVGLVAAFLPIGNTSALSRVVAAIAYVVFAAANIIFYLISLLLFFFLSLLSSGAGEQFERPVPPNLGAGGEGGEPPPVSDTAVLVVSSAFWTIFIVVAGMALLFFLRERGWPLSRKKLRAAWDSFRARLRSALLGLLFRMGEWRFDFRDRLDRITGREPSARKPSNRRRFVRFGSLSPRDQIRYFYLQIVRRAAEQGVRRQESETPLEFTQDLTENWPEAQEDIDKLTTAFLRARYSIEPIQETDADLVKTTWKQADASLRQPMRRAEDEEE